MKFKGGARCARLKAESKVYTNVDAKRCLTSQVSQGIDLLSEVPEAPDWVPDPDRY